MFINDLKTLKELLLWCKAEGIQSIEVAGVKASFSLGALAGPDVAPPDNRTPEQIKTDTEKEEKETLFWSVK